MLRRLARYTQVRESAASEVYRRQVQGDTAASHDRAPIENKRDVQPYQRDPVAQQKAIVQNVMPATQQPAPKVVESGGFLKRMISKIIPTGNEEPAEEKPKQNLSTIHI